MAKKLCDTISVSLQGYNYNLNQSPGNLLMAKKLCDTISVSLQGYAKQTCHAHLVTWNQHLILFLYSLYSYNLCNNFILCFQ